MKTIKVEGIEYDGYDGKSYPARAELIITDTERWISVYDYFDGENWIETEERNSWTKEEIFDVFGV